MDVDSFSSGQESCRKARHRLTDLAGAARQAPSGVAFSLVTLLLATQEKVTRAPKEGESSLSFDSIKLTISVAAEITPKEWA